MTSWLSSNIATAPSSTPSAGLRNSLLAARDNRQELLRRICERGESSVVFLSLNLPGEDKSPPGSSGLFNWGRTGLMQDVSGCVEHHCGSDALGLFALFAWTGDPEAVKLRCVALEAAEPFARLLDFDVYDQGGRPVDRALLGLPPRECLLCPEPARECIRLRRHTGAELRGRVHDLLAPFID